MSSLPQSLGLAYYREQVPPQLVMGFSPFHSISFLKNIFPSSVFLSFLLILLFLIPESRLGAVVIGSSGTVLGTCKAICCAEGNHLDMSPFNGGSSKAREVLTDSLSNKNSIYANPLARPLNLSQTVVTGLTEPHT